MPPTLKTLNMGVDLLVKAYTHKSVGIFGDD